MDIVEFGDLECPACAGFHETLREVLLQSGDSVSFTFFHFPLSQHRFAKISAHALECAADQDSGSSMMDLIYGNQDSIGLKSWKSFAEDAGVKSVDRFSLCMENDAIDDRIRSSMAIAERLGVRATPTVIINGWRFAQAPGKTALTDAIDAVRKGKEVFPLYASKTY